MALRIKYTVSGESNLRAMLESAVKPSIEQKLAAVEADFNSAVDAAVDTSRAALEGTTRAGEFPYAANPPARRDTGAFIAAFRRIDKSRKEDAKYESELGWHDFNFQSYYKFQEEGFHHVGGQFIRGVGALTHANETFVKEMRSRGY